MQDVWRILTATTNDGSAPIPGAELVSGAGRVFYSDVGRRINRDPYREVGWLCGAVSAVCQVRGMPHLNAIVVSKSDYLPGEGIPLSGRRPGETKRNAKIRFMRETWHYPWPKDYVPPAAEIRRAWNILGDDSAFSRLQELHAREAAPEEIAAALEELGYAVGAGEVRPPAGAPYPKPEPAADVETPEPPRNEDPGLEADSEAGVSQYRDEIELLPDRRPERIETVSWDIERDPKIVAILKRRGITRCELCNRPWGLFVKKDGTRFTEVHHIHPLAEGGPDVILNCIELCATCHRWFHHGDCKVEDLGSKWRVSGERVQLGHKTATVEIWKDPRARGGSR